MKFHFLSTELHLGTLAARLGCFPFDNEAYPPLSYCHGTWRGIRSLIEFGRRVCPLAHSVLYPLALSMTLHLNTFRGEPAITGFD